MIYTCPMHPEIKKDKPGMCPECGMNLIPEKIESRKQKVEVHEHDKHAGHSTQMFLKKFWVSLVLTVPVVAFQFSIFNFQFSNLVPFILGSIVFFYGGWVFLASAWRELKAKLPGMMTLIGLAVTAAYLWSLYAIFAGRETLFWELTTLITIMLLGHYVEMRAVSGAQSALKELSKLLPDTAEVIRNGETKSVPLTEIREGDLVFVRPGSRIPTDGTVIDGQSEVNESMITGESAPVAKKPGSEVIAGTINADGSLKIKVTKVGEHTFLAGIMRLVQEAQASKSRLQILSDRAALYLTGIAVIGGIITFIVWLLAKDFPFAVERLVAVLVIACPHALGLAVPLVASISTTLAARHGFLVKQRLALETARNIDVVLFDKTGTLTKGEFEVVNFSSEETLALAAAVDFNSEHPIAKAIVREAKGRGLAIPAAKNYRRLPGVGGEAEIDGRKVFVGHRNGADIVVEADGRKIGGIAVADAPRPEAREAVRTLKALGVRVAMITGDAEGEAKRVAKELGIGIYFSRVLPQDKSRIVKELQEGKFRNWKLEIGNSSRRLAVAMVGDGINDAPALTQADLGIAVGAGTNVAIESAGIILVRNDPRDIVRIVKLSRLTYSKMIQNLFWATGYNVIALPLAAGVLAAQGILLEPALAALFMSLSTVIVAINAVLLKRKTL